MGVIRDKFVFNIFRGMETYSTYFQSRITKGVRTKKKKLELGVGKK